MHRFKKMFLCFVLIAISITSTVLLCSKRKNEIDPLSVGPPRVVRLKSRKWSRLKSRIKKRLRSAFEEKRHRGISISAFYKGEALISAVAGIGKFEAGGKIRPIEDDTMFMPYSVTKGMCATAIATLADRGTIEYDQTIQSIWPQFNCKGKRNVTIATAISHRAGLQHTSIYFLLSGILGYIQKGWKEVWRIGIAYIEMLSPTFPPNTKAIYHPLSWSWIVGGICDYSNNSNTTCKIYDIFRENVATPIGCSKDMFIGRVPKHVRRRTCRLERDTSWNHNLTIKQNLFGILESCIFTFLGNTRAWREICLPSSNGVFTTNSVAKVYGALANRGEVEGVRILSSKTVDLIFKTIRDETHFLYGASMMHGEPARLGLGFASWALPSVHGSKARQCIYHSGMGGFHAYADPTRNLSVCVFSNLYEPLSHLEKNQPVPKLISDITEIIREEVDSIMLL